MSKTTKIILGLIGGGLLVAYSIIRMNGSEYLVQTYSIPGDERGLFCHNGYNGVSVVTGAGGGVVGCYASPCGGGSQQFFATTSHPGDGCGSSGSSYDQQLSCTIDNCIGTGIPTPGPFSEEELVKNLNENTNTTQERSRR